ncbi:MAG: hydrogenase iron-sulfur subunit [Candidatus Thermoplasmatota archaeon]
MTEPKVLVFACNWCSYAGADLAGISRRSYPANALVLRVPCSGRVDPGMILKAFERGADGVLVTGCHPGDCHYRTGNEHAQYRVEMARTLVAQLGIGKERLRIEWISSSEGDRFASVVAKFTQDVAAAGPLWAKPKEVIA